MNVCVPGVVTQRESFPEVKIDGLESLGLGVQWAYQFFQWLWYHSDIFIQPLAFPDSSLFYSLIKSKKEGLDLYIVIVNHVDKMATGGLFRGKRGAEVQAGYIHG